MDAKNRLVEMIQSATNGCARYWASLIADKLLAEGVIVPPVKLGQTVYVLTTDSPTGIEETRISQVVVRCKENCKMKYSILAPCVYDDWGKAKWSFCDNNFAETVFLTREEAEKALAERSGQ